jgi:hypothetical protein
MNETVALMLLLSLEGEISRRIESYNNNSWSGYSDKLGYGLSEGLQYNSRLHVQSLKLDASEGAEHGDS